MSLKGRNVDTAVPFIPEIQSDDLVPTIFWVKPKNMKGTYKSLELFNKGIKVTKGEKQIDAEKMAGGDIQDFLQFCPKVENYEFSDRYTELASRKVIAEITDESTMRLLYVDLDPAIFQEVQNATSNWTLLQAGEDRYKEYKLRVPIKKEK